MPMKPPRTSLRLTRRPRKRKTELDDDRPLDPSKINVDKWVNDILVFETVDYNLLSEDVRRRICLPPSS